MSKQFNQSILNRCTDEVFQAKTAIEAKTKMRDIIKDSKIKNRDQMLAELDKLSDKNLTAIQRYCANALLKFEGLGVV